MTQSENKDFQELFIQPVGGDSTLSALRFDWDTSHSLYRDGYAEAASLLLDALKKKGGDNALVYPIVFLLRHAVELGLKDSIQRAYELVGLDAIKRFPGLWETHNLDDLATKLQDALNLTELSPRITSDKTYWPTVRGFLKKWEAADPRGMFFRYRRTTKGAPRNIQGNLYLGNIAPQAENAIDYLYGVGVELENIEESRGEQGGSE